MYTIDRIKSEMDAKGSFWWTPDTMRFFGTRVLGEAVEGPGGVYFVTSEKPPSGTRQYTVRQYFTDKQDIRSAGKGMCGYKTAQAAHAAAIAMANDE